MVVLLSKLSWLFKGPVSNVTVTAKLVLHTKIHVFYRSGTFLCDQNFKNVFSHLTVSFDEICRYAGATASTRNTVEGHTVLTSRHLVKFRLSKMSETDVELYFLCLRNSSLSSEPHEINGNLKINKAGDTKVTRVDCSCKAG